MIDLNLTRTLETAIHEAEIVIDEYFFESDLIISESLQLH